MSSYMKIGVLGAAVGNMTGVGEKFVKPIHNSGKPVVVMNNDSPGAIPDAIMLGNDGVFVYRVVKTGDESYSVPNYNLDPEKASLEWRGHIAKEIDSYIRTNRNQIRIQTVNELDKNRAGWVGEFCLWQAIHWQEWGYRTANPGWAAGTPEPEAWFELGMAEFLRYCAKFPFWAAVSVHEYNYSAVSSIWSGYPWYIGRFQYIFKAADELKIARPQVFITEWGWEHHRIAEKDKALREIHEVSTFYDLFPQVRGAGLWYSGSYQNSKIDSKVANLFEEWGQMGANWQPATMPGGPEPIVPPIGGPVEPPPTDKTLEEKLWEAGKAQQTISLNPDAALQAKIYAMNYVPVGSEGRTTINNDQYAVQPAESLKKGEPPIVVAAKVPRWDQVFAITKPDNGDPPPPPPPPPPNPVKLDLAAYMRGDGRIYVVRHPNGSQEDFQTQSQGNYFRQVKNRNFEEFFVSPQFIWRGKDTSPGPAPKGAERPGEERYYIQYNYGEAMAKWCPRHMYPGETWYSADPHAVQFYYKKDCSKSNMNSGDNLQNWVKFVERLDEWTTPQGGTCRNVIHLLANGEHYYYAEKYGLIAWRHGKSQSGTTASGFTGEEPQNREDLVVETGCFNPA